MLVCCLLQDHSESIMVHLCEYRYCSSKECFDGRIVLSDSVIFWHMFITWVSEYLWGSLEIINPSPVLHHSKQCSYSYSSTLQNPNILYNKPHDCKLWGQTRLERFQDTIRFPIILSVFTAAFSHIKTE